ncbi:MAG: tetratricopeptide repeat protein [Vicinamibacterales bacterium]
MKTGLKTRAASLLVTFAIAPGTTMAAGGQFPRAQVDSCASGDPQARVTACTQQLGQGGLATDARIRAYVNRGIAHELLDHLEDALRDFQAALDLDRANVVTLRTRAVILHRHARSQEALADLTRAVAAAPGDATLYKVRGGIYADLGQAGRAVEDFSKVLDTAPGDLQARLSRAMVVAAAGDDRRAIQDFNRILTREPRSRVTRAARAFSLFRLKQYALAIQDWDILLQEDPGQLALVYCRGAAKALSGDATGRTDMEQVRQQKPEIAAAQAAACPSGS